MEYVTLGHSRDRISRIAFGCAAIGGFDYGVTDDAQSIAAIHRALDLGVNLFDTADVYGFGHAEEVLGRALIGRRAKAIIATKVGVAFDDSGRTRHDLSGKWMRSAVDSSLRRLQTDVIDIYQLHWPDPATPIEETLGVLVDLQRIGKVRHLGICNADYSWFQRITALARVETVQASYNLSDWHLGATLYRHADAENITVLTYNSLAQGMLTGKYDATSRFAGTDRRQRSGYFHGPKRDSLLHAVDRLRAVGGQSRTCAQVALRWVLDSLSKSCAIAGIKTAAQIEDAVGTCEWQLSTSEIEWLREKDAALVVDT